MNSNAELFSSATGVFVLLLIIIIGVFATFIKGNHEQEDTTTNEDNEKLS
ncbi:MAG: hypothetical protein ACK5N8_04160 [Alphaproteobacteria bacterium]